MEENLEKQFVGRAEAVRGQIVSVACESSYRPKLKELLTCPYDDTVRLEAYQYHGAELLCLLLSSPKNVYRNMEIVSTGKQITIPADDAVLGRAINLDGEPEDGGGLINTKNYRPIYPEQLTLPSYISTTKHEIADTGIKALDFFTPILRGGKLGLVGGAGVGKTVLLTEILRNLNNRYDTSITIFAGIGERIREAHELRESLEENKVLNRTSLILGAINENAAVRFRTAWAAATVAEYFRDIKKQDVIFFVDNVFRFLRLSSGINRHSSRRSRNSRTDWPARVLHQLRRSKLCMCRLTSSPTRASRQPFRTLMRWSCFPEMLLNRDIIRQSICSAHAHQLLIDLLSARRTTKQ